MSFILRPGSIRTAVSFLVPALYLFGSAWPVRSQTEAALPTLFSNPVNEKFALQSLDDMAKALSTKYGVAIMVDGGPPDKKLDIEIKCTLKVALDNICDQFDYSWRYAKSGAVLLEKRYKDPATRPQSNLPEMREMTDAIVRALSSEQYDAEESHWPEILRALATTFTPEQRRILDSGSVLRGSELTQAQQSTLRSAILSNTFSQPLRLWTSAKLSLDNMPKSRLASRKHSELNPEKGAPEYDYLYIYRTLGGALKTFEFPHMVYGNGNYRITTP